MKYIYPYYDMLSLQKTLSPKHLALVGTMLLPAGRLHGEAAKSARRP